MTVHDGALLCGRYRLQGLVGRGGMADVYLAFDTVRQAQVAVKILHEDLAEDPDFVQHFRREAAALARLDHPNIVRFYGFEQDGALAFIVMDYIEGTTLRRQLLDQRGGLEIKTLTAILRDLCGALHYAHLNRVVHRDLKPGNVMLKRDGKALLTDFGIARAGASGTMASPIMGTPPYMSPEQCEGVEPDARSDIYSLGVLLFEMATGRRPFTGEEPGLTETGTPARIQEAHLHLRPPEPRTFNPRLPAAASAVILRALAKRPADRWPDVLSLREAWEAAVGLGSTAAGATAPIAAPDGAATGRVFPRWAFAAVGVVLVVAAAAAVLASRGSHTVTPPPTAAPTAVQPGATVPTPAATARQVGGVVQLATPTRSAPGPVTKTPATTRPVITSAAPATRSPTLMPTRTVTPIRPPSTATPRPTAIVRVSTPTPASQPSGGVMLVWPPDNEVIRGPIGFAWADQGGFRLNAGERYELIVWGLDEDPMRAGCSPVGSSPQTAVQVNLAGVESALNLSSGGVYYWGVALINSDGKRIRMLSEGRKFTYERQDLGGSSQPTAPPPTPKQD